MEDTEKEAERIFEEAYTYHMMGEIEKAIELYRKSIEIKPFAKAYTFLGWAYSMRKDYEKAIECCKTAIDLDPDYGNPYNDIGAYLIEMGKYEEAIPWLERAKHAKNYEPRHFPYINLARVYMILGDLYKALSEINAAIRIDPGYQQAQKIRHEILAMLN